MTIFDRTSQPHPHPDSEITSAPATSSYPTTTYPQDKKPDSSRAEMGIADEANDSGSGFDPKARDGEVIDAVWGRIDANGPNYRNLGWYVLLCILIRLRGIDVKDPSICSRDQSPDWTWCSWSRESVSGGKSRGMTDSLASRARYHWIRTGLSRHCSDCSHYHLYVHLHSTNDEG